MNITSYLVGPVNTIHLAIIIITALLHIVFAGAVAKDAGRLVKDGGKPFLVSGVTWAFAVLIGGMLPVALYWAVHRSSLARYQ